MIPVELLDAFGVSGTIEHIERLTGGHIHGTWAITVADAIGASHRFVAQSINGYVFTDLPACEANMARIDVHFRAATAAGIAVSVGVPRLRRTAAGAVHWADTGGTTWRLADYVESTVAGTTARDAGQAYEAGVAFGRYVHVLSSIGGGPLAVTIDRFHDLRWRTQQLDDAVTEDRSDRRRDCGDTVSAARLIATRVIELIDDLPALPVRSVHNDAKVANIRYDNRTGRATYVVDLDTTMAGSLLFDVGELLRTATSGAAEDDVDVDVTSVDEIRIAGVVAGFIDGAGTLVTMAERSGLAVAGPLMALENAVRFLADHLDADRYFAIEREGQNLDRAAAQLRMCELLLAKSDVVADAANR